MKTIKNIVVIVASCLLMWSCAEDVLVDAEETVTEGEPVKISLQLDRSQMITRAGLSPTQEKAIHSVFVLVFNSGGTKVSQTYLDSNITAGLSNIQTVSGNGMSIYVIANLSPENTGYNPVKNALDHVYTLSSLNSMLLYNLAIDLNINLDLAMYGVATNQTISSTTTKHLTVQMNYIAARVTLYVVNSLTTTADSYALTDWTVQNYPLRSYILPQANDAVVPGTGAHYANSATSKAWVDTTLVINNVSTPAKYAFLYMYENRRGGRVAGSPTDTNQKNKALYAPANATSIAFRGYYKTTATNTVTGVTTTVYLGANNYNDYNVQRGYDYSYIATIKGINDINVDSRVESNTYGYQVNVFNTTMDNHPDRRPMRIMSWPGTSTITILQSDGVTPAPADFWLKISSIDLNQAVNNQRVTYSPATDMTVSKVLTFPELTPSAMASQMVYLYADENTTTTKRNAVVQIVSTAALTNSQTITIPISQWGYQTMGNVGFRSFTTTGALNAADDYILAVENIEEATLNLTPGAAAGTEALTNMQWGFNLTIAEPTTNASEFYYRNGYESTLWLVYTNFTGAMGSTLRPPFGRISTTGSGVASTTITENAMNPIFNTYPARYCFEKNRDLDGDGKITNPNTLGVNEINWYLPSADELYSTYVGQYALTNYLTGSNYQVSSELYNNSTSTNSMSYGTGIGGPIGKSSTVSVRCVRKLYQPQPQATKNSPYVESASRIINNGGYSATILRATPVACPVPMNSQNSAINNKVSPRFQVATTDCLVNGATGASTMSWAEANGWTLISNSSGSAGVVASPATGCQAYSEAGAPAGTWRLPTQREMYQILFMRKELLAGQDGFIRMNAAAYWSNSNLGATLGWYGLTGTSTLGFGGKTTLFNVRCIRDL